MGIQCTKYNNADKETKRKMERKLLDSCKLKHMKGVRCMLKSGVPPDTPDHSNPRGMTLLMCVPYFGLPTKRKTIRRLRLMHRNPHGWDQYEAVCLLLKYGADVTVPDAYGKTVLHHFAGGCQLQALEAVLQTGTDVNVIDPITGNSPLHYTCMSDQSQDKTPIMKLLLRYGVDQNIQNRSGHTALHLCAKANKVHLANTLLSDSRTNLNLLNSHHETALHLCCAMSITRQQSVCFPEHNYNRVRWHSEIALAMIKHGADVNMTNKYAHTVLYLCFESLRNSLNCGAFSSEPAAFGCRFYDKSTTQVLQTLLEYYRMNPNKHPSDWSPLYLYYKTACMAHCGDEYLFQLGADPNALCHGQIALDRWIQRILPAPESHRGLYKSTEVALKRSILLNIQAGLDTRLINMTMIIAALNALKDNITTNLIRLSGVKVFSKSHIYSDQIDDLLQSSRFDNILWQEVKEAERQPLSLQQNTSNVVRISLKPNAILGVKELNLPEKLKELVVFGYTYRKIEF